MTAQPAAGQPFVTTRETAEALWFFGELLTILGDGEQTGGRLAVVEHQAQRGVSPPWHLQPGDDEAFVVLEGEMTFWGGDRDVPLQRGGPGTYALLPRGVPHSFRVESDRARWLTIHSPAGHERFYRAGGEPATDRAQAPAGEPDFAKLDAACREHGVEILGPPPGQAPAADGQPGPAATSG